MTVRQLPRLLMIGGAILIALAAWEWGGARWAQRQARLQAAGALAGAPAPAPPQPSPPQPAPPEPVLPPAGIQQGAPVFRLEIPKINVANVVVYGSTETALRKGPGLIEGMPLPGPAGNSAIAAHRDYFFWRLGELEAGDEIRVQSARGDLLYRVTGKRVVKEWEVGVLDQTERPTLTLITCWPLIYPGNTPDRLVVVADQVATDSPENFRSVKP